MGPLDGVRVLELATGVAGPYAGRLLAMLGADVVKVEPPGGDPARLLPVDHRVLDGLSPMFVHLNAGKRNVGETSLDLERAIAWADIVLSDRVRSQVAGSPLDPATFAGRVLASITAWGFGADDPGAPGDELAVQAASGLLSSTDGHRFPGWQSQHLAGVYAAAAALAALADGDRHHVETTWVGAMLTAIEGDVCWHLHYSVLDDPDRARDTAPEPFPQGAFRCKDGFVAPGTIRPQDWTLQVGLYERPDLLEDERFAARNRWENRDALRAEIEPWYETRTKREIFAAALDVGWAAAMVMTAGDVLTDPHLAARRFLSPVVGTGIPSTARVAGRPWRSPSIPEAEPVHVADQGADPAPWTPSTPSTSSTPSAGHTLPKEQAITGRSAWRVSELRILELTWAWAGPFVGRFLGALGADVVRVETGRYPDGWRRRIKWKHAGVSIPPGVDPDSFTWDASALHNTINRNKRSCSVDLTTGDGRQVFIDLLARADALVVNMSYRMLSDRGLDVEVEAAVERGLVVLNKPALGATGPYRDLPGYGSLMEGMGGLAARFGAPDEGARISRTYYPDLVAGIHGAVALLAALQARKQTGRGAYIDLSQQETTWMQLGEAIVLASVEGRDPDRIGNTEPGHPDVSVEGRLVSDLHADGTLAQRELLEPVDHPVTGLRPYLQLPVRLDGAPLASTRAAPLFAAHTDEVLTEWCGYEPDHLAKLRAAGAIGTVPDQPHRAR